MYSFKNDYSEGAHPRILEALSQMNFHQHDGYGLDEFCEVAKTTIKRRCNCLDADVHFMVGGTQANLTVISAALRPYEAVIACDSGHINVHETGSIESCGHKVCTAKHIDGKLTPQLIKEVLDGHMDEHMVKPAMVYISNSTEIGTIYSKSELIAIQQICHDNHLLLFLDGARLGSALASKENDVSLEDIAQLCDVFYIGGTKNGALFGEAVVITNEKLKTCFRYSMKQKGGLLAKGFLLGVQFEQLLKDDLFFELAAHANECAQRLRIAFVECGYELYGTSPTNQLFPILPNTLLDKIATKYAYQIQEIIDKEKTCVRFVTSWNTPVSIINEFIDDLMYWTKK